VNLVQHELLSPERLDPWLAAAEPGALVLRWLEDPAIVDQIEDPLRGLLHHVARLLQADEVTRFVDRALAHQLRTVPLDASAGAWLVRAVESPDAGVVFETIARSLAKLLDAPGTRAELQRRLHDAAGAMRARGTRVVPFFLRRKAVQRRLIDAACVYAVAELSAAASDAAHPLRRSLLAAVKRFGERLAAGDPGAVAQAARLRDALVESLEAGPMVRGMLGRLRELLDAELADPHGALWELIDRELRSGIRDRLTDPARRAEFDRWVRDTANDLVRRHHSQIGPIVRKSLTERSNDELVAMV